VLRAYRGGARHSVRAAPATIVCKMSPAANCQSVSHQGFSQKRTRTYLRPSIHWVLRVTFQVAVKYAGSGLSRGQFGDSQSRARKTAAKQRRQPREENESVRSHARNHSSVQRMPRLANPILVQVRGIADCRLPIAD